jgi:uncharacterized protein (DUF1501 family)
VTSDALALNPLLKSAAASVAFKPFPSTAIGDQLRDARMISLQAQLNVGRQVFFCSLGGFDTHGGQSYEQWSLLQQVSQRSTPLRHDGADRPRQPGDDVHAVGLRAHAVPSGSNLITAGAAIT